MAKQENDMKYNESKSKRKGLTDKDKLTLRIIIVAAIFILATVILYLATSVIKQTELSYQETSNVDYRVYLKDNDYYDEEYLDENMQYIASLIDHIDITFKYQFNASEKLNSNFTYHIVGTVLVHDPNHSNKVIYRKNYVLSEKETVNLESLGQTNYEKSVTIDYEEYNDTIKTFKKDYNLSATSSLELTLFVESEGKSITEIPVRTSNEMTMTIPLTEQTIGVAMNYNPINNNQIIVGETVVRINNYIVFAGAIITFLIALFLMIGTIDFYRKIRAHRSKYEITLKKLLREYDRLIAETTDMEIEDETAVIDVKSFTELLDIRDNLQLPILFVEVEKGEIAWFIIKNEGDYYRFILNKSDLESEE